MPGWQACWLGIICSPDWDRVNKYSKNWGWGLKASRLRQPCYQYMTKKSPHIGHIYYYNSSLKQKRGLKSHIHEKKLTQCIIYYMHKWLSWKMFRDDSNNKFGGYLGEYFLTTLTKFWLFLITFLGWHFYLIRVIEKSTWTTYLFSTYLKNALFVGCHIKKCLLIQKGHI